MFAERIRQLRAERNLKQAEVAEEAGEEEELYTK